jgi:hypothetical protein
MILLEAGGRKTSRIDRAGFPVARAPSRTFDIQVAIGDEFTKVSMRRLSGHAEGPSDLTGLERFVALEEIRCLTFSITHE